MENYYKILGVKEKASEDDIRARWIKLMRKYHPDLQKKAGRAEGKIKKINEAYQVLKYPSTRIEYDLKRIYGQKKKRIRPQRSLNQIIILISIFVLGAIFSMAALNQESRRQKGGAVPQKENLASLSEHVIHAGIREPDSPMDFVLRRSGGEKKQWATGLTDPKDTSPLSWNDLTNSIESRAQQSVVAPHAGDEGFQSNPTGDRGIEGYRSQTNEVYVLSQTVEGPMEPEATKNPREPAPKMKGEVTPRLQAVGGVRMSPVPSKTSTEKTKPAVQRGPEPPMKALTTQEEVMGFLANYAERYVLKDLEGFMALFAQRALQNHQHGLTGIRKTYFDFFDESKTIRYAVEDPEIEIRPDVVEVKARYELVQEMKKTGPKKVRRGTIHWVLTKEGEALKILYLDYQQQNTPRQEKRDR